MDLFLLQKQMARDSDLGGGLSTIGLSMGMSLEDKTGKQ
jgi:hypothetical protein